MVHGGQPASFSSGYFAARNLTSNSPSLFIMLATDLTRLLGIRVPVVQGGMQWVRPSASVSLLWIDRLQVGLPPLAAAVSNAGGLVCELFTSLLPNLL